MRLPSRCPLWRLVSRLLCILLVAQSYRALAGVQIDRRPWIPAAAVSAQVRTEPPAKTREAARAKPQERAGSAEQGNTPPSPPGRSFGRPAPVQELRPPASAAESSLSAGWNLISLEGRPADARPQAVFGQGSGVSQVFVFDACDAADPWKVWDAANPADGDLASLDPAKGLWVESSSGATLPAAEPLSTVTLHLCQGWNLIGYPLDRARPVASALASIAGKYRRVFGFDVRDAADPWELFDVDVPSWANDLQTFQPGRGYWILVTEDTDLVLSSQPSAPVLQIASPLDLSEVTSRTEIQGSVAGDVGEWRLSARPAGEEDWTPLASGNAPANGALGMFDPTLLLNGMVEIELAATDLDGQITSTSISVVVDGQQKIGNFTLSYRDLEVPLSGLPVEVFRVYDSRDLRKRDFGVGWTLAIRQGSYRNNRPPGEGWQIGQKFLPCDTVSERLGHLTTIRISDREIYRFRVALRTPVPGLDGCYAQAVFVLVQGSIPGAALDILGNTQVLYPTGYTDVLDVDSGAVFEPQQVRLMTRDGRIFDLHLVDGVTRVQDSNGNEVGISPSGLVHSAGPSVGFERDQEGRITRITDTEGKSLDYTYDTAGDLVEVRDRDGHGTRFLYDGSHRLLEFEDPRGVRPVRNEYDAAGRLVRHIDAFGRSLSYDHQLDDRREVVTDRLGHSKLYEYDLRGNIVRTVDAAGHETLRTFDGRGNVLTESDALGNITQQTYDANGELISRVDPEGNRLSYVRDGRGEAVSYTDPAGGLHQYAYDAKGNLLSVTEPTGSTTSFSYDERGNVISETDAEGNVKTYEVDERGNRTRETDALGNVTSSTYRSDGVLLSRTTTRTVNGAAETLVWTYAYDSAGQPVRETGPDGLSSSTVYDAFGLPVARIDRAGRRTEMVYDSLGRLLRTSFPDGTSEELAYDAEGRCVSRVDRAGRTWRYEYDALGRLTRTILPDGSATASEYDAAGRLVSSTDARGHATRFEYDRAGRQTAVQDALGRRTAFTYDAAGNQTSMTDPAGRRTSHDYDAAGRLIRTEFPDGSSRSYAYDRLGRRTSETDAENRTTRYEYDAVGRLVRVVDPLGGVTRYGYDEVGNRVSQTDASGRTTTFSYDGLGRMTGRGLPSGRSETLGWDAAGDLVSRVTPAGHAIGFQYDSNHRLLRKTYPDGSEVSYAYTASGRRAAVTDARGTTLYEHDSLDRLTRLVDPDGRSLSYGYDAAGNRTSLTAKIGAHEMTSLFTWDELNRLVQVTDPAGGVYGTVYDAAGDRASLAYPNGVSTVFSYDGLDRLTGLVTRAADGAVVQSHSYQLGPAGHRLQVSEPDATRSYGYDAGHRLTSDRLVPEAAPGREWNFGYDPAGNRLSEARTDESGTRQIDSTYDAGGRQVTMGADVRTWDGGGNLTGSSEAGTTYAWDYEGRLIRATKADGTVVEHVYDADGNRVRTKVIRAGVVSTVDFLVDPGAGLSQVVAESTDGNGFSAFYVRGTDLLGVLRPDGSRYYHADALGSIHALTDSTGAVTDTYSYESYGSLLEHTGSDPSPYRFAGEALDSETGLYYLRARWLDPKAGAFVSLDPFPGRIEDPRTLNPYGYAFTDPVNVADPSGLWPEWLKYALVGTAVHQEIGVHFKSAGIDRAANLSIRKLLALAIGGCEPSPAVCLLRPDLIDYGTGEIYEIKPEKQRNIGLAQLAVYVALMNLNSNEGSIVWFPGFSYTPPPKLFIAAYGGWDVTVTPPKVGVIGYEVWERSKDDDNLRIQPLDPKVIQVLTMAALTAFLAQLTLAMMRKPVAI